jgi:hypothetical protein
VTLYLSIVLHWGVIIISNHGHHRDVEVGAQHLRHHEAEERHASQHHSCGHLFCAYTHSGSFTISSTYTYEYTVYTLVYTLLSMHICFKIFIIFMVMGHTGLCKIGLSNPHITFILNFIIIASSYYITFDSNAYMWCWSTVLL